VVSLPASDRQLVGSNLEQWSSGRRQVPHSCLRHTLWVSEFPVCRQQGADIALQLQGTGLSTAATRKLNGWRGACLGSGLLLCVPEEKNLEPCAVELSDRPTRKKSQRGKKTSSGKERTALVPRVCVCGVCSPACTGEPTRDRDTKISAGQFPIPCLALFDLTDGSERGIQARGGERELANQRGSVCG
jgi:hypothetical protein